jgi:hypothetical protein
MLLSANLANSPVASKKLQKTPKTPKNTKNLKNAKKERGVNQSSSS